MELTIKVDLPDEAKNFFDYVGHISTALCCMASKLGETRLGALTPDEAFTEMVTPASHTPRAVCEADEYQTSPMPEEETVAQSAKPTQTVPKTEEKDTETVALETVKKLALTLMRQSQDMSARVADIVHQKGAKISALADDAEALNWVYDRLRELFMEAS